MSFTQKVARFFEKHESLMNIPIVKSFVIKQLNVLPPAREQEENNGSSLNSRRNNFINELSNNGKYRKLEPIQNSEVINKQIIEENER